MAVVKDPVCGMEIDTETAEDMGAEILVYEGETYYFCCPPCRRMFEERPDHYINRMARGADFDEHKPGHP